MKKKRKGRLIIRNLESCKFFKIMRLSVILLLFCMHVAVANVVAQAEITIEAKRVTFLELFNQIKQQTGLTVVYSNNELDKHKIVEAGFMKSDLRTVLDKILKGTRLTYEIVDEFIVLKVAPDEKKNALNIVGLVTDKDKVPLPGVTVIVKGSTLGTATDQQGRYRLSIPEVKNLSLLFSFIGMKTREVVYTGKDTINVVMEEDVATMDEVVVTGIYERKRSDFTGSASTFTAEKLKEVGNQNILQSLKSLDPAFAIVESNEWGSDPNRLPNIEIRGKTSIIGMQETLEADPNQPLFILDGFETTLQTIVDLDLDRVASITILKDAASTAIYGSKAANGVVVVETKTPAQGQLRVTYTGNFNFQLPDLSSYNLMNAREKVNFEEYAGRYMVSSWAGSFKQVEKLLELHNAHLKSVAKGVDTYWLSEPLRVGFNHRHSLYAEGGDEHMRYGFGLSYNGVTGVMKDSKKNLFSGNLDLLYRKGKLQFSNKLTINLSNSGDPVVAFSTYAAANPYYEKKVDGQVEKWLEYVEDYIEAPNPLWNASLNSRALDRSLGITDNFAVEYNPFQSLKLRGRIGLTRTTSETDDFVSPEDTRFEDTEELKKGSLIYSNTKSFSYDGEFSAIYGMMFAEKHRVNLVAGANFSNTESESNGYSVIGFPKGNYDTPAFANSYPENGRASYSDSKSRAMSVYLNGGYAFNSRYLMDVTYRMSGSSVFGSNRRYTNTWSFGLAWNLHNESFFAKYSDLFQMLKIRASIGNPGNQSFASYQSMTTYKFNNRQRNYFDQAVSLYALGNPDLKWQVTIDKNIGLDVTLLQNRVSLTLDYYDKNTDPVLASIGVPASIGVTSVLTNIGEQSSNGFNGSLVVSPIYRPGERIVWSLRYSFRTQKSKYDKIGHALDRFNEEGQNVNLKRYYDGASPDDLWAVRSAGIDPATGREIFIKKDGSYTYDFSYSDEVKVGVDRPKVEGTFGTSLTYKGFSVNFDFRYRYGGQMFNSALFNKVENITSAGLNNNQDKRAYYDRWKEPGDHAKYKAINLNGSTQMSSRFVEDDNTLALESFRVGYEFDQSAIAKFGLKALRLNAYMNDVFKISSIKTERGTEYPFARSFSLSISASF